LNEIAISLMGKNSEIDNGPRRQRKRAEATRSQKHTPRPDNPKYERAIRL